MVKGTRALPRSQISVHKATSVSSVTFCKPRTNLAPPRRVEEEEEEPVEEPEEEPVEEQAVEPVEEQAVEPEEEQAEEPEEEQAVEPVEDEEPPSIQKPPLSQRPTIVEEIPLSVDEIIVRTGTTTSSIPLPVYRPDRTKPKPSVPKHYMAYVDDNMRRTLIPAKQLDPVIDQFEKTQANYRKDKERNEKKIARLESMANNEIDQINELMNEQVELDRRIEEVEEMKLQVINDRAFLYTSYQRMVRANRTVVVE